MATNVNLHKEKAYLLAFIFSLLCMAAAVGLKIIGLNLFAMNPEYRSPEWLDFTMKTLVFVIQYILIVGCAVLYPPKKLMFKMLPYLPLVVILHYLPEREYSVLSTLILFVPCIAMEPRFRTLVRFFATTGVISVVQLILIWLRLDVSNIGPVFPSGIGLFLMSIDQFVILALLYNFNRKRGDKNGVYISRTKEKEVVPYGPEKGR